MSAEGLEEIRARWQAATPGPWEIDRYSAGGARIATSFGDGSRELIADTYQEGDREAFYHAPTDVAFLLAAVEGVLGLHRTDQRPTSDHYNCDEYECDRAGEGDLRDSCTECRTWAPCPTVKVIMSALEGRP